MRLVFELHGGVEIDYSIGGSNNSFSEKARNVIESLGHECVNVSVIKSELSDNIELFLAEIFGGNSEDYDVLEKSIRCETGDEKFKIHGVITFDVSDELEEEFDWSENEFDYSDVVSNVFDESINVHGELITLDPLYDAMGEDSDVDFVAQYFEKQCEATLYLD
jgi:hypothetical protein